LDEGSLYWWKECWQFLETRSMILWNFKIQLFYAELTRTDSGLSVQFSSVRLCTWSKTSCQVYRKWQNCAVYSFPPHTLRTAWTEILPELWAANGGEKDLVFWVVMPCGFVGGYRRFQELITSVFRVVDKDV
jgi:hypothetical protein